jgi:plasmid stability protein
MKQLLVRNLDEQLVSQLKQLAARNGVSAEEQHRRILQEGVTRAQEVREPLGSYLVNHPVCPDVEIPLDRSRDPEARETGLD